MRMTNQRTNRHWLPVTCVKCLILSAAFVLWSAAAMGDEPAASPIWGKPIMPQTFDKQPFGEVKLPDWLWDITRYTFCVAGEKDFAAAAKAGSQMVEVAFGDPQWVYYDSKLLARKAGSTGDPAAERLALCKRYNVRSIGAIPPCLQTQMYKAHPDWRAIPTNTKDIPSVDLAAHPEGGTLCEMGPWGDFLIDVLAEIVQKYPDLDGFGFDGIHHGMGMAGVCYCQHCREGFRKATGLEMPNPDMNDPNFRRLLLWEDRRMEAYVERMQERLKTIKPGFAIVTWTTNAGRFGHFLDIPHNMSARMNLLFDAPSQEFWLDETNRGNTVVPAFANAYIWAVTNHRVAFSEPYLMSHGNPYGTDSFPEPEMLRRVLLALSYGVNPALCLAWPDLHDAACRTVTQIARRSPWLTHKRPEPWAALLMSDPTRNFYGRDRAKAEERYVANVLVAFRVGVEEHLPVTVINDWNLNADDLAPYKVLVLPNDACLSDAQAEAVRQFVRNGGGLVASNDTSLFDELGNPRKDFALADVFGAHYQGVASSQAAKPEELDINFEKGVTGDYWENRKGVFAFQMGEHPLFDSARLKTYLGRRPVTFRGQAVRVGDLAPEAKSIGTIALQQGAPPRRRLSWSISSARAGSFIWRPVLTLDTISIRIRTSGCCWPRPCAGRPSSRSTSTSTRRCASIRATSGR